MALRRALLPMVLVHVAVAEDVSCSCDRVAALEDELASQRASLPSLVQKAVAEEMAAWQDEMASLRASLPLLVQKAAAREMAQGAPRQHVDIASTGQQQEPGGGGARRLGSAHGSTFVSVASKHVHEFPSGHQCGATTGYMQFLPVKANGDATWAPSPSDVSGNMTLVKVATDWTTTTIQEAASPIKVVHDSGCSAAPTLELPLDTSIPGFLTVGSINVDVGSISLDVGATLGKTCYREAVKSGYCDDYSYLTGFSAGAARLSATNALYNVDPILECKARCDAVLGAGQYAVYLGESDESCACCTCTAPSCAITQGASNYYKTYLFNHCYAYSNAHSAPPPPSPSEGAGGVQVRVRDDRGRAVRRSL